MSGFRISIDEKDFPIELESISIRFDGRDALDNLSLAFERGKSTAIIGNSGSGKSLTLKCAAGLIFPDDGHVLFEGKRITGMSEKSYQRMQARTGFHFQDAALWANKSLGENLSLPLLAADPEISDRILKRKVMESFESVGLELDPSLRPAAISMGQQKMVSFLRATITRPEILFLDDSLSFLDHSNARQLIARIEELKHSGVTILFAAHEREFTGRLADSVVVLSEGRLITSGPYEEVMSSRDPALLPVLQELV